MQTPLTNEQKRGNMDNNAKLRPLYLAKILYEMTDEEHTLSKKKHLTHKSVYCEKG